MHTIPSTWPYSTLLSSPIPSLAAKSSAAPTTYGVTSKLLDPRGSRSCISDMILVFSPLPICKPKLQGPKCAHRISTPLPLLTSFPHLHEAPIIPAGLASASPRLFKYAMTWLPGHSETFPRCPCNLCLEVVPMLPSSSSSARRAEPSPSVDAQEMAVA